MHLQVILLLLFIFGFVSYNNANEDRQLEKHEIILEWCLKNGFYMHKDVFLLKKNEKEGVSVYTKANIPHGENIFKAPKEFILDIDEINKDEDYNKSIYRKNRHI